MTHYKRGMEIGSFVIEALLSDHGGMATILLGKSVLQNNLPIVLKIAHVSSQNAAAYEQLLLKETDMLHDLRHPGIVRIYPISQYDKRQFFGPCR